MYSLPKLKFNVGDIVKLISIDQTEWALGMMPKELLNLEGLVIRTSPHYVTVELTGDDHCFDHKYHIEFLGYKHLLSCSDKQLRFVRKISDEEALTHKLSEIRALYAVR